MTSAPVRFYGELWKGKTSAAIRKAARDTARFAVKVLAKENKVQAYDSGLMSRSWLGEIADKGIILSNTAPYSAFVIGGTKRMKARPILQKKLPEIEAHFRKELGKQVGAHLARNLIKTLDTNIDWGKLTQGMNNE